MNWEQYKKLSRDDKEEWRFRFERKTDPPKPSMTLFIALYSLIVMQIFVSLSIYLIPSLASLLPKANTILESTTQLVNISLTIIIGAYLVNYGEWFYQKYKEHKWLKSKNTVSKK